MATKFEEIPNGRYFKANGLTYQKNSPQTYIDPTTGIENYWDPLFDTKIESITGSGKTPIPSESKDEYKVDPQTRVVERNPKYLDAGKALGELWGSGLFDCGPLDYEFMVTEAIKWGKAVKKATAAAMKAKKGKKAK